MADGIVVRVRLVSTNATYIVNKTTKIIQKEGAKGYKDNIIIPPTTIMGKRLLRFANGDTSEKLLKRFVDAK